MTENKQTPVTVQTTATEGSLMSFWNANGKKIGIVLGVIIVLTGGYFAYKAYIVAPKEEKAAEAMFQAETYFKMDSVKQALNGDNLNPGFLKIISKYGGTKAANLAHFYAGNCYLKLGDFNNAVKQLKDFSTDAVQVEARALSLLGDAYSELGKKEDAITAYKKAGNLFEEDESNSPGYLFRAGYLYESMGKNKEAIEIYKLIKKKYPRSVMPTAQGGQDIDKYLARLGEAGE